MSVGIQFLGAAGTVTGSKYLLRCQGTHVLADCGLFQGLKSLRLRNWEIPALPPQELDAVILTHAHLDHSGYLPVLTRRGFDGTVIASRGTRDLCKILLPDSGHLQEEEAAYANRRGFSNHKPALPLYTEEQARASLPEVELGAHLARVLERKGVPIKPAFAVGRAQALLHYISRLKTGGAIPDVPVFLNSPMAIDATQLYHRYRKEHRLTLDECQAACTVAAMVHSAEESKGAQFSLPDDHHLGQRHGDRRARSPPPEGVRAAPAEHDHPARLQAAGTRGASLAAGAKEIKIHGGYVRIGAKVVKLDSMSAHADYTEILRWLGSFKAPPRRTFVTHGEPAAADEMRRRIEETLGWEVHIPEHGESIRLS